MQIDWITVSAQIVNFLILVWLLKRFLYRPVIKAMERREQRIGERLNEAARREQQATQQQRQYEEKEAQLTQQRDQILAQSQEEAEQQKLRLLEQARDEVATTRHQWQHQVEQEKAAFMDSLRRQSSDAIQAMARKALSDLANSELEEQIVNTFIARLAHLDEENCKALAESKEAIRITTSYALDDAARTRLTNAIHECITADAVVEFQQSTYLLCGIELISGGHRVSWNLEDYMDELAKRVEGSFGTSESLVETSSAL